MGEISQLCGNPLNLMGFKQNSSGGQFLPGLIGTDRNPPETQSREQPGSFPLGRPVAREDGDAHDANPSGTGFAP